MLAITRRGRSLERGDTLLEVLVAITVLGVVVVGAFSLMNRGVAQMYDSMEKSEVRLLLNRQIEALTYARDQYLRAQSGTRLTTAYDQAAEQVWENVRSAPSLDDVPPLEGCDGARAFWLETSTESATAGQLTFNTTIGSAVADTFPSPGNGIWVQKIDSSASVPYKDLYIRACWVQTSSPQTQVLSTVVRLYDK